MVFIFKRNILAFIFQKRFSVTLTCDDLVSEARKAFLRLLNTLYKFLDNTIVVFVKIFNPQSRPTAQYGSETWGIQKNVSTEKVHLFAIERFVRLAGAHPITLFVANLEDFRFT